MKEGNCSKLFIISDDSYRVACPQIKTLHLGYTYENTKKNRSSSAFQEGVTIGPQETRWERRSVLQNFE